jgi:hypothetical protein
MKHAARSRLGKFCVIGLGPRVCIKICGQIGQDIFVPNLHPSSETSMHAKEQQKNSKRDKGNIYTASSVLKGT